MQLQHTERKQSSWGPPANASANAAANSAGIAVSSDDTPLTIKVMLPWERPDDGTQESDFWTKTLDTFDWLGSNWHLIRLIRIGRSGQFLRSARARQRE